MTRRLIKADGTTIDMPSPMPLHAVRKLLGADAVDTVPLRHMGSPLHVLLVDDHGWEVDVIEHDGLTQLKPTRALKPINPRATDLYRANCYPGTQHQIAGDAYMCPDDDYE